jgi:endonuclease/exonuclease/phosphatase family metal-dependent hydrolase
VNDLIDQLQEREPEANIAVLGDFNDVPEAEHMRTYIERNDLSYAVERTSESDPRTLTHESDRAIDFILVSPALKPEVVEGSGFVLGTPLRASGADWRTVPAPTGYAADHLPVAVDIVPKDR